VLQQYSITCSSTVRHVTAPRDPWDIANTWPLLSKHCLYGMRLHTLRLQDFCFPAGQPAPKCHTSFMPAAPDRCCRWATTKGQERTTHMAIMIMLSARLTGPRPSVRCECDLDTHVHLNPLFDITDNTL
jgi:hypothetical protein